MEKSKWSIIFAKAIILAVVVVGGVYSLQNKEAKPKDRTLVDCSKLDSLWTRFSNDGTSLSFCYPTSWGTSELKESGISSKARVGTDYYIIFSESVNYIPKISYSTLDFQLLGDSDVPQIDWNALDFRKSETKIAELVQLFHDENINAQKLTVNGKQILKVNRDFFSMSQVRMTLIDYLIPNVMINETMYNLRILGLPEQEADLNKLLESMTF